jgi:hypothetical protein
MQASKHNTGVRVHRSWEDHIVLSLALMHAALKLGLPVRGLLRRSLWR